MTYDRNAAPAIYDHRGLWCLRCNAQQSHYRSHKAAGGPWACTACEHVEGEPINGAAVHVERPTALPVAPRDGSTVVRHPDRSPEALQAYVGAVLAKAPEPARDNGHAGDAVAERIAREIGEDERELQALRQLRAMIADELELNSDENTVDVHEALMAFMADAYNREAEATRKGAAAIARAEALRDQIERGGCAAAHAGETTYECDATKSCGLCRLRGRAEAAERERVDVVRAETRGREMIARLLNELNVSHRDVDGDAMTLIVMPHDEYDELRKEARAVLSRQQRERAQETPAAHGGHDAGPAAPLETSGGNSTCETGPREGERHGLVAAALDAVRPELEALEKRVDEHAIEIETLHARINTLRTGVATLENRDAPGPRDAEVAALREELASVTRGRDEANAEHARRRAQPDAQLRSAAERVKGVWGDMQAGFVHGTDIEVTFGRVTYNELRNAVRAISDALTAQPAPVDSAPAREGGLSAQRVVERIVVTAIVGSPDSIALVEQYAREQVLRSAGPSPDNWVWMPSGGNHLESMGERMAITITASALRGLLADRDATIERLKTAGRAFLNLAMELDVVTRPAAYEKKRVVAREAGKAFLALLDRQAGEASDAG